MLKNHLNDKWESVLEECLTEYGFTTFRLSIDRKTNVKCSGVLMAVNVEGRKDREFKIGHLIMKAIGDSRNEIEENGVDIMFKTEAFVYNEVLSKFDAMQTDLASSNRLKFPLCYKATKEYVLIEDIVMRNFAVKDGPKILDFDHMSFALMELGRYHALSFALKQNDKTTFDKYGESLQNGFFTYPKKFSIPFDNTLKRCLKFLDDNNLKNKFEKRCRHALENLDELKKNDKYHVICHGDFTTENIFFAHDQDDEPSEIAMLDYQLSTMGSPVMDVLCLLFTAGSSDTIQNYEMMLDMYHDSLKLFLKKFQCLSNECYPKSALNEDMVKYFPYAFTQAVFTISEIHNDDDEKFYKKINELTLVLDDLDLL